MRDKYVCPVDGCGKAYRSENELRGHIAGMMQHDERHEWDNLPVTHTDLSAAKVETLGFD